MKYIERYIYAVTHYLPEKDREEVGRELKSNIEDMLQGDYSEENIKQILEELGSPYELSTRYLDQEKFIIGPRVYHIYIETLKILMVVAIIVGAITFTVDLLANINSLDFSTSPQGIIAITVKIIAKGIGIMFNVMVGFFFWVTFGFIIVEKTNALDEMKSRKNKAFVVEDLKEIPQSKGKNISKVEMAFTLVLTIAFLFIFLFKSDLISMYIAGEGSYPIFNSDTIQAYMLVILVTGALSISLTIYKLILGRWSKKLAIYSVVYALVSLVVTIIVVQDPNLFDPRFLNFISDNVKTWGIDLSANLGKLKLGFILIASIITVIEISTALYQGFRKERSRDKL